MKNIKELKKDIDILVLICLCIIAGLSLFYQHELNEVLISHKESALMRNIDYLENLQQKDIHLAEMLGDLNPEYFQVIEVLE